MAKTKVYEIEATTLLRHSFEVDATSRAEADELAREALENNITFMSRDRYDTYDIDIEQVEESEGH